MDLVVGATGILGQQIALAMAGAGRSVRALVRAGSAPEKVAALKEAGIETVVGDLKDPASLTAALAGVDNVVNTASSTLSRGEGDSIDSVDRQGGINLVQAAKDAGVGHFVYVSFPDMKPANPLRDAKAAVEAALRESGLSHTILQPTHFWEVWCSPALGFDVGGGTLRVYGDGDGDISWISMFDVLKAAVASLDNPKAVNKTIPLGGPEVLNHNEIIRRFEAATGRTFERETVPLAALEGQIAASEHALEISFAALMHLCGAGGWVYDPAEASAILGFEPASIDGFISMHA